MGLHYYSIYLHLRCIRLNTVHENDSLETAFMAHPPPSSLPEDSLKQLEPLELWYITHAFPYPNNAEIREFTNQSCHANSLFQALPKAITCNPLKCNERSIYLHRWQLFSYFFCHTIRSQKTHSCYPCREGDVLASLPWML